MGSDYRVHRWVDVFLEKTGGPNNCGVDPFCKYQGIGCFLLDMVPVSSERTNPFRALNSSGRAILGSSGASIGCIRSSSTGSSGDCPSSAYSPKPPLASPDRQYGIRDPSPSPDRTCLVPQRVFSSGTPSLGASCGEDERSTLVVLPRTVLQGLGGIEKRPCHREPQ